MHYKDGQAAKLGDIVKGTFYLPLNDGTANWGQKEAVGLLAGGSAAAETCNAHVLVGEVHAAKSVDEKVNPQCVNGVSVVNFYPTTTEAQPQIVLQRLVTANCGELELVHRPT